MAVSLFKLVGSVFVDTEEANNSLAKTSKNAEKTGVSFKQVAATAGKIGTAVVAAAGTAVTSVVALASSAAETADEVDKASIRMGISAESYQEYAHAASLAGVETSTLERAAKALEGTDISFDDAMKEIMSFSTAEERAAKASELFGDTVAYNMSPLIEQSAEDFEAAKNEAHELGLVMSDEDVKAGAKLNDTLSNVKDSFGAIATHLGSALMPVVQEFASFILQYMPTIQGVIDQLAPILSNLFAELMPPIMELVDTLFPVLVDLINEIMPVVSQIISDVLPIIINLLNKFAPLIMEIISELLPPLLDIIEAILPVIDIIMQILDPILEMIMELVPYIADLLEAIGPLITVLLHLISEILEPLMPIFKFLIKVIGTVLKGVIIAITGIINGLSVVIEAMANGIHAFKEKWIADWTAVGNFFKGIGEGIRNIAENIRIGIVSAFSAVKDKVVSIFNGLKEAIKVPINWIIDKINGVFSAIGTISIPDWVPGIGGTKFSLPQIPRLAEGGLVDEGQIFAAREAGPELVGSYGSKTAVMNNDQIVEAVSRGVAKAVASVLGNNDGMAQKIAEAIENATIIAKVSEEDVFRSVRNKNRQYIEMTGVSALV
jgi:phage-related protein